MQRNDIPLQDARAGPPKAVALLSGGLDSLLAVRVVQEQGVQVEALNFFTGFCVEGHTHAIRAKDGDRPTRNNALRAAEQLGIRLHFVDVVDDYRDVVLNPRYGYGANLNPCLDCKIFMVQRALEWMRAHGFQFIITGEVIGQRPMSQRKDTMSVIMYDSGAEDFLLRPLSAKLLPPTRPEREGWVDRQRLHNFSGRSRKPQMALAARFGLEQYPQPAGGCCFLTDPNYAGKLADLWKTRGARRYELDDIVLLKVGRHFRPAPHFKVIVARDEGEGRYLHGYRRHFVSLRPLSHPGPEALVDGRASDGDLVQAARLVARYSQGRGEPAVQVEIETPAGALRALEVAPLAPQDVPADWAL
jgi:tRNA-uridine 2-sulfurtransferase